MRLPDNADFMFTDLYDVSFSATTISFGFVGPTDTGGIKVKAYAVQYKEVKQSWDEGRNKSWPVGKY